VKEKIIKLSFFANGDSFAVLDIKKFYQNQRKGLDRNGKKNLRISALTVLNNELPDVKNFFEDNSTLYHYLTSTKKRHRKPMPFLRKHYYCFIEDCHMTVIFC